MESLLSVLHYETGAETLAGRERDLLLDWCGTG